MATVDDILGRSITDAISASLDVRKARARLRVLLLKGFGFGVALAALAYGVYEWRAPPLVVSTDDAYVGAVFAQVTPQIDGTVAAVLVHDTQSVQKGDVLIALDPKDAQLDFDAAKAAYEEAYRRVQQEVADINAAEANVLAKRALVAQAEQQLRRRTGVRQSGIVAAEEVSNSRSAFDGAKYSLSIAEHQLAAKRAIAGDAAVESNPEILAAKANLERSKLRVERTLVRAPVDGIVAQSRVQIGEQVAAGTELMTVVPMRQLFVDANFKESQIMNIRAGQLATLKSDIYGSARVFHGYVEGVGGGTGAAFAVIPPQNATGNWIKVVQRLPIRIALDPADLKDNPLRVGISMSVDVHLDRFFSPPDPPKLRLGLPAPRDLALRSDTSGLY
ncbi:MAG TPA: HlyD family efflux transporter periplasmic adaptor subunit [Rhizomicrobium sp.]|jgi:membrane fusion protein (multidrug efflux system)